MKEERREGGREREREKEDERRRLPVHDGLWYEEIHENQRKVLTTWSGKTLLPYERPQYTERSGKKREKRERVGRRVARPWRLPVHGMTASGGNSRKPAKSTHHLVWKNPTTL